MEQRFLETKCLTCDIPSASSLSKSLLPKTRRKSACTTLTTRPPTFGPPSRGFPINNWTQNTALADERYVSFKLALTEEVPTIKPYAEDRWALLPDVPATPIEVSMMLLECLHTRWVLLLRSLAPDDWKRTFRHPELGVMALEKTLAFYAWHGRHHVAHITSLREKNGW